MGRSTRDDHQRVARPAACWVEVIGSSLTRSRSNHIGSSQLMNQIQQQFEIHQKGNLAARILIV